MTHSPTPWSIYAQPIASKADAILECIEQVQATAKIDDHIYLLESEGKCPSIVGCGPCSKANAEFIIKAVNTYEANQALIKQLVEALSWMVDNDETCIGDEPKEHLGGRSWNEANAYWIEGLNKSKAALSSAKEAGFQL